MPRSTVRSAASALVRPVAVIALVAAALQIGLAGGGAFGAPAWRMHVLLGMSLAGIALVLLAVGVIARPERRLLAGVGAVFVLTILQPVFSVLAERMSPWFGLLHSLGGFALLLVLLWLALGAGPRESTRLASEA